jgi:hypothetical protein
VEGRQAAWRRDGGPPALRQRYIVLRLPPDGEARQVWVKEREGVEAAFEEMCHWLRPRFLTWAAERSGPGYDIEDALHDAIVRLWEKQAEAPSYAWIRWAWRAAGRIVRRRRFHRRVMGLDDEGARTAGWAGEGSQGAMADAVPVLPGRRERLVFWLTRCLGLCSVRPRGQAAWGPQGGMETSSAPGPFGRRAPSGCAGDGSARQCGKLQGDKAPVWLPGRRRWRCLPGAGHAGAGLWRHPAGVGSVGHAAGEGSGAGQGSRCHGHTGAAGTGAVPWARTRGLSQMFGGPVVALTVLLHDGVPLPEG